MAVRTHLRQVSTECRRSTERKRIGTNSFSYPQSRNFIETGSGFATYVKLNDVFRAIYWLYARLPFALRKQIITQMTTNLFFTAGIDRTDLRHLFNTLAFGSGPWVVTYESELPRWRTVSAPRDWIARLGLMLLASKSCKRIIAISQNAVEIQQFRMENDTDLAAKIMPKITILHPPQKPHFERWQDKDIDMNGRIRFVLVGDLFFMKGGAEVLRAFDGLLRKGHQIELDIVSRLLTDNWASATGPEDISLARRIISAYPVHIRHKDSLPNAEVITMLKEAHIGLLPSYAETYGYFILEAQSCGCPVISTDISAMPEINNNGVGWLIPVPKRDYGKGKTLGRSRYNTKEGRREISQAIETGLREAVSDIIENRDQIRIRGQAALDRIRQLHDPIAHAERLKQIYADALAR
jgi:glycosyltransferase involved in cell wall biosynthesis